MKRIVIVDYNHQLHQYINSKAPRLYYTDKLGAQPYKVETTIPTYTIKGMHNYARKGIDTLAVCFDSKCTFRKEYFANKKDGTPTDIEYKGGRKGMTREMYEGASLTLDLLAKAKVPVYKVEGYEADDLVYSLTMICKELYPNTPIDIVTNDSDLLPLVDEQVSVFLRSAKLTWAVNKEIEKRHYWQVIPENYAQVVEGLSKYAKFDMPYNTVLLHKLLRGDSADGIPGKMDLTRGKQDFPPKMYNELISIFRSEGINLAEVFRYVKFYPREVKSRIGDSMKLSEAYEIEMDKQVKKIYSLFEGLVDDYEYMKEHIDFVFKGLSPRFVNLYPPEQYNVGLLSMEVSKLGIQLPV